jgi:hypothetical protein
VEEATVLGDVFNSPDDPGMGVQVQASEFRQSVLLIKGLAGMVTQARTQPEKLDMLCSGDESPNQPLYCVFSFFDQQLKSGSMVELELQAVWLQEAVTALTQLLNTGLEHPFLTTCTEICHEFFQTSLAFLTMQGGSEDLQYGLVHFLSQLGQSRHLGRHMMRRILDTFSDTADQLREANRFHYRDSSCLQRFHLSMTLVLEMWPLFSASVVPCRSLPVRKGLGEWPGSKRKSQEEQRGEEQDQTTQKKGPSGKKRFSGGGMRPVLSLSETWELQTEVAEWRETLAACTEKLSVMEPDFCQAVWRVDNFCEGLVDSLAG